jgi:glycopeptide antibiotics resistance protein
LPSVTILQKSFKPENVVPVYTELVTNLLRSPRAGFFLWVVVIICVTTMPWSNFKGHAHWSRVRWIPFEDHPLSVFDVVGNVLLFVPFGLFFVKATPKRGFGAQLKVAVLALLLSASVEFFQIYCHNRFPSATDVCTNVIGAVIGSAIGFLR